MGANTGKHGDRIRDTAASVSGSTVTLNNAAPAGFQTFGSFYADQDVCPSYLITDGTNWEVSYGVYTASGTTLARASTPISSSNGGSQVVSFSGTIQVACTDPAADVDRASYGLSSGYLYINAYPTISISTTSPAVGTVFYVPVVINQWFSAVNIHCNISSLAGGTSTYAVGIYNNLNAQPQTRLGQATGLVSGNQGGGSTGDNASGTITLSAPQPPGLYWVGYVCATNSPSIRALANTEEMQPAMITGVNGFSSLGIQQRTLGWTQSNTTLPTTAGSLTGYTSSVPVVGVAASL